jgi:endonuclease/exonuclease/phosphatase family metal-dependent hydrolase
MRIASFNVESLFNRPRAMNMSSWDDGKRILQAHARINELFNLSTYTMSVKTEILNLLTTLGLRDKDEADYAILRQNRGHLLTRHVEGTVEITATGRVNWIGWVELTTEPVNQVATTHTARVIKDVDADIQAVVEADNRVALRDFSAIMLGFVKGTPYDHVMLIDGNDQRGIDVGVLTRTGFDIVRIRSHVDDADSKGQIFSRDCPEYTIKTPSGAEIVLLVNHLKSKGFGKQSENDAKRKRQATRVAEIYKGLQKEGQTNVVVLGDFNDFPGQPPLVPLLGNTDLRDITDHPKFTGDGRPGTFQNGTKSDKIDYILLSPNLFSKVTGGRIFRKGVWGGKNGTLFPHYPTMTGQVEQASDHAAIYADIKL